jgi:regulator of RNase E activity RraA
VVKSAATNTDPEIGSAFGGLPTTAVFDVLRIGGFPHQVLSSSIARLGASGHLAGPAFCARGETLLGGADTKASATTRWEMFRRIYRGSILVVGSGGYDEAVVFGENVIVAARARGCAGVVADGGVRDLDGLKAMDIPIFARFATPVSSAGRWRFVELDAPVTMPGQTSATVIVRPGDILVGDSDGVIVVPAEHAGDVAADSRRLAEIEDGFRPRLASGEDPEEVYAGAQRFAHIRRHRD